MSVLSDVCLCITHVPGAIEARRGVGFPGTLVQTIVNLDVGDRNQTWVLCSPACP